MTDVQLVYFCLAWRILLNASLDSYPQIAEVIEEISALHKEFSWEIRDILTYNLSKSVSRVINEQGIDKDFQTLINEYKTVLNINTVKFLEIQNRFPSVRFRIKQGESISEKLFYYKKVHENGGIPINKCLNDFLGFRLMVSNSDNICTKIESDESLKESISRMYPRTEGSYSGFHLYFKNGNNKFFPWELQIWDVTNAVQNELSHKDHKQKRKYISLPQNYRDGNLEKEG